MSSDNASHSPVVLSGIRPTSSALHIGNYFGALRQFVHLQEEFPHQCYFFIADLHTIADVDNSVAMSEHSFGIALEFLAAGVDPNKSTIYLQSSVPELSHLAWLLTACVNDSELLGLPHYREKRDRFTRNTSGSPDGAGGRGEEVFSDTTHGVHIEGGPATYLVYPILQSADILFAADPGQTIIVPVGQDQRPHIEFTRDVARRFNNRYQDLFGIPTLPEDIGIYADDEKRGDIRIKGLDGQAKMGKSEGNAIYMEDSAAHIQGLIRRAPTDPKRVRRGDPGNPQDCIGIYPLHEFLTPKDVRDQTICPGCLDGSLDCSACKQILLERLELQFGPFRERKQELQSNPAYVERVLHQGGQKVRRLVCKKISMMHQLMGLAPYPMDKE